MSDKPDNYAWHEALDRAFLLANLLSKYVEEHPVVAADPDLTERANEAVDAAYGIYQAIVDKAPHMRLPVKP